MLIINCKENKSYEEAYELLKENGFDVEMQSPLRAFCNDEAEFRISEMEIISDEEKNGINTRIIKTTNR